MFQLVKILMMTSMNNESRLNFFRLKKKMNLMKNTFACFDPFFTWIYSISLLLLNHFLTWWTFRTWRRTRFTGAWTSPSPFSLSFSIISFSGPLPKNISQFYLLFPLKFEGRLFYGHSLSLKLSQSIPMTLSLAVSAFISFSGGLFDSRKLNY